MDHRFFVAWKGRIHNTVVVVGKVTVHTTMQSVKIVVHIIYRHIHIQNCFFVNSNSKQNSGEHLEVENEQIETYFVTALNIRANGISVLSSSETELVTITFELWVWGTLTINCTNSLKG